MNGCTVTRYFLRAGAIAACLACAGWAQALPFNVTNPGFDYYVVELGVWNLENCNTGGANDATPVSLLNPAAPFPQTATVSGWTSNLFNSFEVGAEAWVSGSYMDNNYPGDGNAAAYFVQSGWGNTYFEMSSTPIYGALQPNTTYAMKATLYGLHWPSLPPAENLRFRLHDASDNSELPNGQLYVTLPTSAGPGYMFYHVTTGPDVGSNDMLVYMAYVEPQDVYKGIAADDVTPIYPGDADIDGDVDNTDLGTSFGNYTGVGGAGKTWFSGDFDGDADVDNTDLGTSFGNYTGSVGPMKMIALSGNPDVADLIYDPATGNVKLDASEAAGEVITNFVLKNAPGGDDFITGVADFPFPGLFQEDLPTEISNTDGTAVGFEGVWDLGDIFVTGLDEASLSAWLTQATYVGALGTGVHTFDFVVVPEPSTLALLTCGLLGLLCYAWRRRK